MVRFLELTGSALLGVAFLAPLTWPLLIAAATAFGIGSRRQHEQLSVHRMGLLGMTVIQWLPSFAILFSGAVANTSALGGRAGDDLIPSILLAQLPIAAVACWWCQRVSLCALGAGLLGAAFSVSAAFTVLSWGRPL